MKETLENSIQSLLDHLNQEEPIQCLQQLKEEFDLSTKLLKTLQQIPESHARFQITLARFLKSQQRIFAYKSTQEISMEGK